MTDLTKLDAANRAAQAHPTLAKVTKAFDQAATDAIHAVDAKPSPSPGPSGGWAVGRNVREFGAIPGTDATDSIQACLDACVDTPVIWDSTYKVSRTLKLNQGQHILGTGIGDGSGNDSTLLYVGPDKTNAIEMKTPDLSKVSVEGLIVKDKRVGATGGSGIYLYRAKNYVAVKRGSVFGFPDYGVACVADPGQNDTECIHIEDMWVGAGVAGIFVQQASNNVTIQHIMGDGLLDGEPMKAVVRLGYTLRGGVSFNIHGVKLETDNGCHVLHVESRCRGAIVAGGLSMRGTTVDGGGDIVRLDALEAGETRSVVTQALASSTFTGSGKVCKTFVNPVGGTPVGNASMRTLAQWATG